jgi:proton-translocating NADH-quinone oxidoreductase chain N
MFLKIELIAMAPEFFLVLIIHILIIYGVICTTSSYLNYPILLNSLSWLAIQTLFFSIFLNFKNPLSYTFIFNNLLIIDQFSIFIKTIIIITTICTILISIKYNQFERINSFELVILLLLAVTGILLLVSSFNFISIYLAIELQSFCLYILAALNRNSEFSTEAGLKYFILGAFSSGLLLFGISLIYGFTGISNLGDLFQFLSVNTYNLHLINSINLASIFIIVGLLFKLSAVPFHLWGPDIYEGSPTSITLFFGIVPKIGILALLTRFTYLGFYDIFFSWQELFIISSIFSILLGTFGALSQLKFKRLLAYSTIGHIGYILIGFSCGCFEGIQASYIYIILYIIMTIISFIIILGIYKKKNLIRICYLQDLNVLKNSNPLIAISIILTFFSMAGIPPFSGFFSKMFIFIVTIQSCMYSLAIVAVITSVVSCFYYLRIIKLIFFEINYLWVTLIRFDREKSIIISILTIFVIFIAIYPLPIIYGIQNILYFVIRNQFDFLYT